MKENNSEKYAYVDTLRGLAILGVIMVHTSQYGSFEVPSILSHFIGQGSRGVQLFYLASAFTIFLSYSKRINFEKAPVKNFFIRRYFRIAPMYYLGICYYLFQDGFGPRYWLGDATHISSLNIISNFTFLHGLNPYWITSLVPGGWSIAIEMSFYLMIPFLFKRIKDMRQAIRFLFLTLLLRATLFIVLNRFPLIEFNRLWSEYLFLYLPSQLPIFALGILMYFMVFGSEKNQVLSSPYLLSIFCLFLIDLFTGTSLFFPKHILFGFGFLGLGIGLSKIHNKVILNPFIRYVGKVSYSMYLIHFAVLFWLTQMNFINYVSNGLLNYSFRFLVVITLSLVLSTISYKLLEIPFQRLGSRLILRLESLKP